MLNQQRRLGNSAMESLAQGRAALNPALQNLSSGAAQANALGSYFGGQLSGLGQQAADAANYYGAVGDQYNTQGAQDRSNQYGALANLQNFYQQGPGPSAA